MLVGLRNQRAIDSKKLEVEDCIYFSFYFLERRDSMQTFPDDWPLIARMNFLQRKIILNSIMYYMYNTSCLSDHYYDSLCKQLVKMQEEYGPDFVEDSRYGYVFNDFDGSTGFHLYSRLNEEDKTMLRNISIMYKLKH